MSAVLSYTPNGAAVYQVGSLAWCVCPSCDTRLLVDINSTAQLLLLESMFDDMLSNHRSAWCTTD